MSAAMSVVAVVQRQLDAYNARDLTAFLACYGENICTYRPPSPEPVLAGKHALGRFYAEHRFNLPALHAELVKRMVLGNKVIDHERITGVRDHPFEVAVVYEVVDGLICHTWTHAAE
jgi:hypothetical protein